MVLEDQGRIRDDITLGLARKLRTPFCGESQTPTSPDHEHATTKHFDKQGTRRFAARPSYWGDLTYIE